MTTISIDFGTSNTVIAILDNELPQTIRIPGISRIFLQQNETTSEVIPVIPSLVFIQTGHQWVLGQQVRSKRLGLRESEKDRLFKAFKRELVADYQSPPRNLEGILYTPEFVSERFLEEIWQQLKLQNIIPTQIIFAVPVEAFERYLDWFRNIGPKLGVDRVQIVDESTAAALGYAVHRLGSLVLVVDFGGGTLDLSLVRTIPPESSSTPLKAEVIAKSGTYVGGEDIDRWIVEDYLRSKNLSQSSINKGSWQALLDIAEKTKIKLSRETEAKESWFDDENFMSYDISLNRDKFKEILEQQQFLGQLRDSLDEVLNFALNRGISKNDIQQVLLVGGSCLIPAVQQIILSYFGKQKVALHKPFEAVCHGALYLSKLEKIEDYLRHSYVIRLWHPASQSYTYYPLFEAGLKYPCQRTEALPLQSAVTNQKEIRLDIGELAKQSQAEVFYDDQGRLSSSELNQQQNFRSLESHHQQVCVAHLDPPGQLGSDRLSVQFEINEKRELLATVQDLLTDKILAYKTAIAKLE